MAATAPLDPPGPGTAGPPCAGCGTTGPHPASVFESVRYRAVRDAKRIKWAAGLPTDLTPEELDAVLPPADSRAARIRIARRGGHHE